LAAHIALLAGGLAGGSAGFFFCFYYLKLITKFWQRLKAYNNYGGRRQCLL